MDINESIEIINGRIEFGKKKYSDVASEYIEALEQAVEALLKQEPMKVYERPISDGTVQFECPSCHCEVRIEFLHPYCWHCGQAIDWEDCVLEGTNLRKIIY